MTQFQPAVAEGEWLNERIAAESDVDTRADFIRRTYLHLLGAVLAFAVIDFAIFQLVNVPAVVSSIVGEPWIALVLLGVFLLVAFGAEPWARSTRSIAQQYVALGAYVVIEAIIFVPLLYVASQSEYGGVGVIPLAAMLTGGVFAALTMVVFISGADFSFLKGILAVGMVSAIGLIIASAIMGFTLGLGFTAAMIALAGGFIVYDTSNVLHRYRTDQHVAASLALFASVALLFWYMIRLLLLLAKES